jgi:hypothetical protein
VGSSFIGIFNTSLRYTFKGKLEIDPKKEAPWFEGAFLVVFLPLSGIFELIMRYV